MSVPLTWWVLTLEVQSNKDQEIMSTSCCASFLQEGEDSQRSDFNFTGFLLHSSLRGWGEICSLQISNFINIQEISIWPELLLVRRNKYYSQPTDGKFISISGVDFYPNKHSHNVTLNHCIELIGSAYKCSGIFH